MKITANLNKAIESHIEENLDQYIQFGEFDPSLSALEATAHKINTYSDSSSVYEAIDGDPVLAKNLFSMVMEREYFDETETRISMRKCLLAQASRTLLDYEAFAWQLWERGSTEPAAASPGGEPTMPELAALGKLIADFETEFAKA